MKPMANDERLRQALRDRGQRVTTQRLVLLRALHGHGRHATVDELLRLVADDLPGLSLPTVYATLQLFEELGLVRRLNAGSGPVLYDPVLDGHHHVACRRCGRVEDLVAEVDLAPVLAAAAAAGHRVTGGEVVVSGVCAECARSGD